MNDVPGALSLPGSGTTAYWSVLTPASSTSPVCHGPEMNEPKVPSAKPLSSSPASSRAVEDWPSSKNVW